MNKIEVNKNEKSEIVGIHTYSKCDIRHPQSAKLEKGIEQTIECHRHIVNRAKMDLLKLMIDFGDRDRWDDTQLEQINLLKETIQELKRRAHFELKDMYATLRDFSCIEMVTVKNIIPTAGRAVIARWITGDNTYDAANGANYGTLGDDNTAPANGDTTLGNETYRKATSSASFSSNVAYLSNFYTASETTGTFEEAGWHIDGTASADTGELLSHFLTTSITKTSVETLIVESELTIN